MKEFSKQGLKNWELGIIADFPDIFTKEPSATVQSYIDSGYVEKDDWVNLRYGFECDSGWEQLIREYCTQSMFLLKLLHDSGFDPTAKIYGCIIKEKFGVLTIQNDATLKSESWELYLNIVRSVENKSQSVCESTGKFGRLRNMNGWLKTLSDEAYHFIINK